MEEAYNEEEAESRGFFDRIRSVFAGHKEEHGEQEPPRYKRRLLDGRIEKYLDQNMSSYISEFGILTGLDIEGYEVRYEQITGRIAQMKDFMLSSDARISEMEREIELVTKASKGGK